MPLDACSCSCNPAVGFHCWMVGVVSFVVRGLVAAWTVVGGSCRGLTWVPCAVVVAVVGVMAGGIVSWGR